MVCVLAATVLAFSPLFGNGFVNYDDPFTLQHNEQLAAPGILKWAFTTTLMGHYQPVSWLAWSGIKDLFGANPLAFHSISLLLHLVNAALIYLVSIRLAAISGLMLASRRPVALAASALFALHPARVEVVAWASAFPYALSLSWLLLSLLAYLNGTSATASRGRWLAMSIGCFVLALLSRPIGLGFPFVLLALDAYPLRRATRIGEKIPFFVAAILIGLLESSSREATGLQEVGIGARMTTAATAPFVYLARTLVPIERSPIEVRAIQPQFEWLPLLLGVAGGAATTLALWRLRHRRPGLLCAWFAFLVLLAPVIGLTPSGQQTFADRYLYVPGVVLSILAGGLVAGGPVARPLQGAPGARPFHSTTLREPHGRPELHRRATSSGWPELVEGQGRVIAVLAISGVLGIGTWHQTLWWRDSITLWTRAADLDSRNDIATYNLAIALVEAGREAEAAARFDETLRLIPDHEPARRNLTLLARQAERKGDDFAAAGRFDEAVEEYTRALARDAGASTARSSRGIALMRSARFADAARDLGPAFDARPDDLALANGLAYSLIQTERFAEAVTVLKRALARHPDDDELAHNLARVLATAPDPAIRDGALALRLASAVRARTGGRDPRVLDTLAAAYAAAGQMPLARAAAAEAVALAKQLGQFDVAEEIARRAQSYEK
jgi:tetratricopeptide (TPR) repeat protein